MEYTWIIVTQWTSNSTTNVKAKTITACAVATSCCISDMPSQWEGSNLTSPHSSEIWGPIVLKLKFKKHVRGTTQHAKYGRDRIKCVGGANTTVCHYLGCTHFFVFLDRLWRVRAQNACFRPRKCPLGVSMIKVNVWGQKPRKTKILGAGIGVLSQFISNTTVLDTLVSNTMTQDIESSKN